LGSSVGFTGLAERSLLVEMADDSVGGTSGFVSDSIFDCRMVLKEEVFEWRNDIRESKFLTVFPMESVSTDFIDGWAQSTCIFVK
jgi:hypothetical protein